MQVENEGCQPGGIKSENKFTMNISWNCLILRYEITSL